MWCAILTSNLVPIISFVSRSELIIWFYFINLSYLLLIKKKKSLVWILSIVHTQEPSLTREVYGLDLSIYYRLTCLHLANLFRGKFPTTSSGSLLQFFFFFNLIFLVLQHVDALEILLQGLCGVPKERLRIHELCLKSGANLGNIFFM